MTGSASIHAAVSATVHEAMRQDGRLTLIIAEPDRDAVTAALLEGVRREGTGLLDWNPAAQRLRERLQFLHGAGQLKQLLTSVAALSRQRVGVGQQIDLDQIQELMHMRIDGKLDLAELAATAQLSKFHFSRRFKQVTGQSPIQHFINLKMEFACSLHDSTSDSIKKVAAAVGYSDPYYFSRLFKQVIGVSPSDYRVVRHA